MPCARITHIDTVIITGDPPPPRPPTEIFGFSGWSAPIRAAVGSAWIDRACEFTMSGLCLAARRKGGCPEKENRGCRQQQQQQRARHFFGAGGEVSTVYRLVVSYGTPADAQHRLECLPATRCQGLLRFRSMQQGGLGSRRYRLSPKRPRFLLPPAAL